MKALVVFIVTLVLVSLTMLAAAEAHPCHPRKDHPHHCHKPEPVVAEKKMEIDRAGYGVLGAISSVAVGKALRDQGLSDQNASVLAIASALLLPLAKEENRKNREDGMQSAVLGAITAQYLTFEF